MNKLTIFLSTLLMILTSLSFQTQAFNSDVKSELYKGSNETESVKTSNDTDVSQAEIELSIIKNAITNLLSTEIAKESFQLAHNAFSIELTIDEQGIVTAFRILEGEADQNLLEHINYIVQGWQIEGLNPTGELKLIVPLMIL